MLVAYNEKNSLCNLAEESVDRRGKFFCPACKEPVRVRKGQVMRAHFAHISLKKCHYFSENESEQHLFLKSVLYRWLRKDQPVVVERLLPDIQQVADLWVDPHLALEVQCSTLPIKRLQERTQAYQESGRRVLWLLGKELWLKERITKLQKQFLSFSSQMGFHLWELDCERKELRLCYMIHEDLHGNLQYLTRSFPFFQGKCLDVFRLPFTRQKVSIFSGKIDQEICHYARKQLYYRNPKWLIWQEKAYLKGRNLLLFSAEDFYPQIRPIYSSSGFCQIEQDLSSYYQQFLDFYRERADRHQQVLYSPAFYTIQQKTVSK